MSLILGVDPGNNGALAVYDNDTRRIVSIDDMPFWWQSVGKKKRKRVDAIALAEKFDTFEMMSVDLMVMEAVGGRTGQSASAGFVFGYGVGLIYMAALYNRLIIETVPPATWKKIMNVPGKLAADDTAILARADELFPHDRHLFRGPSGGKKIDRAEAAMIARFGADHILPTMGFAGKQVEDTELKLAYGRADTGA